ncbi:Hpt domain-containing protein [Litoreibacter janthinus]|uniref:Hpt domain-containing protein n=1 Tax=Litoreibacter janthinus TaxID=670154 RepID=UPI00158785A6
MALLDERLDKLELEIDGIALPQRRARALASIQAEAHKIAGTAAVIGFSELGQIAALVDHSIASFCAENCNENSIKKIQGQVDELIEAGVKVVQAHSAG